MTVMGLKFWRGILNRVSSKGLSRIFYTLAAFDLVFMLLLIVAGFPPRIAGHGIPLRNLRTPCILLLVWILAGTFFHPDRAGQAKKLKEGITTFASRPSAVWWLAGFYGLLFTWQQVADYLSVEINFLNFSFHDYMPYFLLEDGKINYTGFLHHYYHANNILLLLAPVWFFLKSPFVLILSYGFMASLAAVPLHGIARLRFKEPVAPLAIAFVYLNYNYLQNLLLMNFSPEILYSLFVFGALYAAMRRSRILYYLAVLMGLLVKEDSFVYFSALAGLVFFLGTSEDRAATVRGFKQDGILTIILSLAYFVFLKRIFFPVTHNHNLEGDALCFLRFGNTVREVIANFWRYPAFIFFGSKVKLQTWLKLLSKLVFLPLFTPAALLIFAPLLPVFMHSTGGDVDYHALHLHFAGPVIPFVFIAMVFGFSNLYRKFPARLKEAGLWTVCVVLLFLNAGHFKTVRIEPEDLRSIRWAKDIPTDASVVTHGHLLPYLGYRKDNFYMAPPYELPTNPAYEAYRKADYYSFDIHVNPYPLTREEVLQRLEAMKQNPAYVLLRRDGNERFLFKRQGTPDPDKPGLKMP